MLNEFAVTVLSVLAHLLLEEATSSIYLTLPYEEDVLQPSAEASNRPNAHLRINRKATKSPSSVHTWVHTNTWNHPLPSEAYSLGPTPTY